MNFDFRLEFRKREDLSPDLATDGVFEAVSAANSHTSDFSAGTDGWTASAGAVAGNIDTIGGQDDNLRFTVDGANSIHYAVGPAQTLAQGKAYRIRFDYYIPNGQSNIDGIRLFDSGGSGISGILNTTDAWTSEDWYWNCKTNTGNFRLYAYDGAVLTFQDAGGDDVFYLRNVIIDAVTFTSWTDTADGLAPDTDGVGALTDKASWDGSQVAASQLIQPDILTPGALARIVYTLTRSAGTMTVKCGTASGTSRNSAATYTETIMCAGNGNLIFEADADFVGTVDVVSAKVIN